MHTLMIDHVLPTNINHSTQCPHKFKSIHAAKPTHSEKTRQSLSRFLNIRQWHFRELKKRELNFLLNSKIPKKIYFKKKIKKKMLRVVSIVLNSTWQNLIDTNELSNIYIKFLIYPTR